MKRREKQGNHKYTDAVFPFTGIIRCEKCGAIVPVGSAYCSKCGAKVGDIFEEDDDDIFDGDGE